jgi:hypothetical protein
MKCARCLPIFAALLTHFANASPSLDREVDKLQVKARLAAMVAEDQSLRLGLFEITRQGYPLEEVTRHPKLNRMLEAVDRANTRELDTVLDRWGWITVSEFGPAASKNAWLLAQHADRDLAFQEKALQLMTAAFEKKDVSPADYAYLWDRVRTNRGELQRYGTQGRCSGPGQWVPHAMEKPEEIDARRNAVGLPPHAEYISQVAKYCL